MTAISDRIMRISFGFVMAYKFLNDRNPVLRRTHALVSTLVFMAGLCLLSCKERKADSCAHGSDNNKQKMADNSQIGTSLPKSRMPVESGIKEFNFISPRHWGIVRKDCAIMDKLFLRWSLEVDSVKSPHSLLQPKSRGYTFSDNDIYGRLESLRALIHAPVSNLSWASYISQEIEENDPAMDDPRSYGGEGRYIYLSLGACERFGWSQRGIVAEIEPSQADPKSIMDTFLLHSLVRKRLKDISNSGNHSQ